MSLPNRCHKHGMARKNSHIATETISSLIKKMLDLLTLRMDLDIEVFKASNPEFYAQYKAARVIDKPGTRITMLNLYVYDATEEPACCRVQFGS